MGIPVHVIDVPNGFGAGFAQPDRVFMGLLPVPYPAGSGAGAASTGTANIGLMLPPTAQFFLSESADVTAFVANNAGGVLTLTVEPRNPANTVAAGSIAVLLIA